MGGTIKIHMFGAYFGLAASVALGMPSLEQTELHESSNRSSDVFSLIGTIFLWIFWPTFNGAGAPMNSQMQQRIILNTIFALTASCVTTFVASRICFKKKFGPVDIQNATLAGGVMVGATCNYLLYPGGAIAIGMIAGCVSVVGYNVVMLKVETFVHDSCGIHNLHGMPSVAGAIVSVVLAAMAKKSDYKIASDYESAFPHGHSQWSRQLLGSLAVLGFAMVTGYMTMFVCKKLFLQKVADKFRDKEYWDIDYRSAA
jgi:ammonium transporter Rh